MLSDISRNKDSQTIKFGQSTKCKMINIFVEKPYTKCCLETSPRSLYQQSQT